MKRGVVRRKLAEISARAMVSKLCEDINQTNR